MDTEICFFTILLSIIFILLGRKLFLRAKHKTRNLPPGPWKLPILGNMHQLLFSLPHLRLADLAKKYGPIMHLQLGQLSNVVISSPEVAKEVLKTHDLSFASRPFNLTTNIVIYDSKDLVFSPYGEHWRQLRKICITKLLSAKCVQSFGSIREEEVSNLIRSIASSGGEPVNLSKMLTAFSFSITSRTTIGKSLNLGDTFTSAILKISSLVGGFSIADVFPSFKLPHIVSGMRYKLQKLHEEVDAILETIINERIEKNKSNRNDADDLLDVCLKFQDQDELGFRFTKQDIKAFILDVFIGGVDTSATLMEWAMSELIKNPKILKKAQAEVRQVFDGSEVIKGTKLQNLTCLSLVIQETLRLHPPAPLIPRAARETVEICGYKILKNTGILINTYALARDPNYWIEPERFYPERFLNCSVNYKGNNFEYLPFGAGRRVCPGMMSGLSVNELVLANLLYHFDWKVPDGTKIEDFDMSEDFSIVVRRKNDLLLAPIPYNFQGVK